ncbi:MAG: STAS domain-containing protein [Sedimenticola sp.]|uniref:STAS domain-containing protein n=1 Tax=Sedimenticola thiotaurini TaxID=1543721 RepID=A0A558DG02_9GAMM|nr:STAS domain-containing protein [Sedimenticola sp.]MDF1530625.1 STAS domain-containing protein [Sedimenticola sp.]TVT59957.1 MAG: STAS domain-containing protein [Sedimenticola thiotaurini]
MTSTLATMDDQGVLRLEGDLIFANVTSLLGQIDKQLQGAGQLIVDLEQVRDVDSSGLVLLLEVQERAQQRGVNVRFRALSDDLLGIARLSNVENLLLVEEPKSA